MPTWLVTASTKALAFLKQYWALILVVVLLAAAYSVYRQQQASVADTLDKVNKAHAAEIDQITQARASELAQKQAELDTLQDAMAQIQRDYVDASVQIVIEQRQEVTDIVKRIGDDPTALAERLAQVEGFQVVGITDAGAQ